MKHAFTILLLLVAITATFYPCCQLDKCSDEEIASTQHEKEEQSNANCSPLFACPACPAFAELSKPLQLLSKPEIEKQIHTATTVTYKLSTYAASLWQPPRSR